MKIAILYICTGKYDIFWQEFYESSQRYFLSSEEKVYFVFSDAEYIKYEELNHVRKIYQKSLGWPGNTLYRYHIFYEIIELLNEFDYVFFFNANMKFLKPIDRAILPSVQEGLLVTQHPGFYNKRSKEFTYERRIDSSAYIPIGEGIVYVCGGFNGGTSQAFIELIKEMKNQVDKDDDLGIVAIWHDESHINKYILTHSYKLLDISYAYPEGWKLPFDKKILIRDKTKYGGHVYLRDVDLYWYQKIIISVKKYVKKYFNYRGFV